MSVHTVVAATKVLGTRVFSPTGALLGHISEIMIEKVTGRVTTVTLAFGGFLGVGENHHSLDWSSLKYDAQMHGYVAKLTPEALIARRSHESGTPDYRFRN